MLVPLHRSRKKRRQQTNKRTTTRLTRPMLRRISQTTHQPRMSSRTIQPLTLNSRMMKLKDTRNQLAIARPPRTKKHPVEMKPSKMTRTTWRHWTKKPKITKRFLIIGRLK